MSYSFFNVFLFRKYINILYFDFVIKCFFKKKIVFSDQLKFSNTAIYLVCKILNLIFFNFIWYPKYKAYYLFLIRCFPEYFMKKGYRSANFIFGPENEHFTM